MAHLLFALLVTVGPINVQPIIIVKQIGTSAGQIVAQQRANYMAIYNHRGHPPRRRVDPPDFVSVGSFEGVGWTSRKNADRFQIGTCRPSGRSGSHDDNSRRLVGDAVAHGTRGSYRVRIWARR